MDSGSLTLRLETKPPVPCHCLERHLKVSKFPCQGTRSPPPKLYRFILITADALVSTYFTHNYPVMPTETAVIQVYQKIQSPFNLHMSWRVVKKYFCIEHVIHMHRVAKNV